MVEYNEKLMQWINCKPSTEAGVGNIQNPGEVEHLVWQNRYREPSEYEQSLIDHLIQAFAGGAVELDAVVASLNTQGLLNEGGEKWTTENFTFEMARLGY